MPTTPLLAALLLLAAALPGTAQALGVGGPLTHSALGQPLNLLFPLRLNADETLSRDCVHAEVLAGEARVPQGLLQFRLEGDGEGRVRAIRLLSSMQIDEPIVTVNLSLGCPARLTRQFTAFVDPADSRPVLASPLALAAEQSAVADLPPATAVARAASAPMPATAPATEARAPAVVAAAAPPAAPAVASAAHLVAQAPAQDRPQAPKPKPRSRPKAMPAPAPATVVAEAAVATKPASAAAVSRLRMDPPETPAEAPVAASAASAADAASVPASATPFNDQTLARLQQLEDKLDQVHRENVAAEDQFKLLRTQLEEARGQRYHNVLVYGLGMFLAALALICAYLWRSRRREREAHEKAWWSEVDRVRRERDQQRVSAPAPLRPAAVPPSAPLPAPRPAFSPQSSPQSLPQTPRSAQQPSAQTIALGGRFSGAAGLPQDSGLRDFDEPTMASAFVDGEQRGPWPGQPVAHARDARDGASHEDSDAAATAPLPLMQEAVSLQFAAASRNGQSRPNSVVLDDENHEVSVEELIDLELQVDFFEVLGQDEAAMDLLRQRIASGQASELPYLKLMEIHQRRGEEADFSALAVQFAQHFKALPPVWGAKLAEGRNLEAYGRVLDFVQQHWSDSGACMALLQNLLSHGGEDAQGFDLPAYLDLLMLYGLAREHSEREVRGQEIDLFLPLDTGRGSAGTAMMATQPVQTVAEKVLLDLHLDIDLDQREERQPAAD